MSKHNQNDIIQEPVPTTEGPVIGTGRSDSNVVVYKGIPFAAPPVGDLRWKAPQPAPERSGVFEAKKYGPFCTQTAMLPEFLMGGKLVRSEDCLYLNIWRPKKEGTFPVMVWIHGGALIWGSGSEIPYRGDRLVGQKDVVYVSINYRLGAFGFLAHPELSEEDPNGGSGNYGLLDQIAALKWVKNNIANFGGDPDNVTIFGESAGGWSVCNLLASPLANGLFNRAIMQSGGADNVHNMERGFAVSDELRKKLGCSEKNSLAQMRSKSANEILDAMGLGSVAPGNKMRMDTWNFLWTPHIDGHALKEFPIESIRSGNYNKVPLITGATRDEAKLFAPMNGPLYRMKRNSHVKADLLDQLGADAAYEFEKLYPYEKYKSALDAFIDGYGDMGLGCRTLEVAEASSLYQPTYYYRFDYDDSILPNILGAAHALEIPFIFNGLKRPYFTYLYTSWQRTRAKSLVDAMMGYWTNFAKSDDPNGPDLMEWPKYETSKRLRMYLDIPQRVGPTDNIEKRDFWKKHGPEFI